jgi:hypothetical protein
LENRDDINAIFVLVEVILCPGVPGKLGLSNGVSMGCVIVPCSRQVAYALRGCGFVMCVTRDVNWMGPVNLFGCESESDGINRSVW